MFALDVVLGDSTGSRLVNALSVLASTIVLVTLTVLEGEVPRLVSVLVQAEFVDGHFAGTATRDLINETHNTDAEPQGVDGNDGEEADAETPDGLPLGVVSGGGVVTNTVETEVGAGLAAGVPGEEVGTRSVLGGDTSGSVVEAAEHFFCF